MAKWGVPNQLIVCMLSESWYGGYQLATVWRAVGHGGYQVSSVGNVRVGVHGGGASKELAYKFYAAATLDVLHVLQSPDPHAVLVTAPSVTLGCVYSEGSPRAPTALRSILAAEGVPHKAEQFYPVR